jgi:hypothetical protein
MRSKLILAAIVAALPLAVAAPALSQEAACADLYLELNGEVVADESICLPPEGGELPGLPEPPVRSLLR